MNLELLLLISYIFILTIIGLSIFLANKKSKANFYLGLLIFFIIVWSLTVYLGQRVIFDYDLALFFVRTTFIAAIFISAIFLLFSYVFPSEEKKISLWEKILILIPAFLVSFLALSRHLVSKIEIFSWGSNVVVGSLYNLFAILFSVYIILGFYNFIKRYKKSNQKEKAKILYLFLGVWLSLVFASTTNLFLPLVTGRNEFAIYGPYSLIFLIGFTSYAITRHRLMDIRLLIVRSVMYFLLLAIFAVIYMASIFVVGGLIFGSFTGREAYWASMFVALFVGFTVYPLKNYFTKISDKIFFKDRYDFEELTSKLNETATSTIVLPELLFKFLNLLIDEMRITKGAFVLLEGKKVFEVQSVGYRESFSLEPKEVKHLAEEKKLEVFEEAKEGSVCKEILRKKDASVIVPLITEDELIGLLFLGNKKSGDSFSDKDIKVVEIVSKQLSLGIQNAKAYEKTQKFNITLKAEVNRATRELRGANEKLQELDKAKDEFISLASHEIRTPIATLEGYVSILNDPRLPQKDQKTMIERAYEGVERLSILAKDLLDVSRIDQKRMKLNKEMVRLESIIQRSLDGFELQANDRKIYLKYKKPERALPQVYIDPDRIGEVFNNLIGNAIKFTHKGGITVKTEKRGKEILVAVSDTGAGIPKESISHIFEKFYQAETASSVLNNEKGGTGLGLYITKHIVDIHGGKIWLESKLHKGTTLYFTIPINKK